MKITSFDKRNTKALQDAMTRALEQVGKDFGVTIKPHGGTLGSEAVLKFKAVVADPEAAAVLERSKFAAYCSMFNLKPEHYGATILHKREEFKLIGLMPSRPKFPILVRRVSDGGELLLTEVAVRHLKTFSHPNHGITLQELASR